MLCAPSCQNTQALIFVFASKWRFDAHAVRSRSGSLVSGFVFFFFSFFFSSRHSVLGLDKFHAACKQQGLDFSECLRGGSGQWLAWGGASPWRLEDTGGGGAQRQRSLQTRFFDLEMTQPALLMNFNPLHLMCGALCCSQSATAHLYPPQTYSTVDDLFADSIFKVKSSRTEQPEGKNKNKSDYL